MSVTIPSRGPAVEPGDDVEQALLSARALVDAALSNHRRRATAPPIVELPPDEDATASTVRRCVALTRTELICVPSTIRSQPALAELGTLPPRGIGVRMLCGPDTTLTGDGADFTERALAFGIEVRLSAVPLPELLMTDDRVALVRPEPGGAATVTYAPSILRTLKALFDGTWRAALPVADRPDAPGGPLTRDILDCLNAGHKDDAAARKLGLSVRTYRRHVADLLRDMGAESRFQAGARAAELHLLAPPTR
jgi:hypothetical protein